MSYIFSPNARPISFLSSEASPADRRSGDARPPLPPVQVGEYLVAPVVQPLANGWFASSVSIRSACGSADRVLRLTRLFQCAKEAGAYARAEALQWIGAARRPMLAA